MLRRRGRSIDNALRLSYNLVARCRRSLLEARLGSMLPADGKGKGMGDGEMDEFVGKVWLLASCAVKATVAGREKA